MLHVNHISVKKAGRYLDTDTHTHTQEPMRQVEAEIKLIQLHTKENSGWLATTKS